MDTKTALLQDFHDLHEFHKNCTEPTHDHICTDPDDPFFLNHPTCRRTDALKQEGVMRDLLEQHRKITENATEPMDKKTRLMKREINRLRRRIVHLEELDSIKSEERKLRIAIAEQEVTAALEREKTILIRTQRDAQLYDGARRVGFLSLTLQKFAERGLTEQFIREKDQAKGLQKGTEQDGEGFKHKENDVTQKKHEYTPRGGKLHSRGALPRRGASLRGRGRGALHGGSRRDRGGDKQVESGASPRGRGSKQLGHGASRSQDLQIARGATRRGSGSKQQGNGAPGREGEDLQITGGAWGGGRGYAKRRTVVSQREDEDFRTGSGATGRREASRMEGRHSQGGNGALQTEHPESQREQATSQGESEDSQKENGDSPRGSDDSRSGSQGESDDISPWSSETQKKILNTEKWSNIWRDMALAIKRRKITETEEKKVSRVRRYYQKIKYDTSSSESDELRSENSHSSIWSRWSNFIKKERTMSEEEAGDKKKHSSTLERWMDIVYKKHGRGSRDRKEKKEENQEEKDRKRGREEERKRKRNEIGEMKHGKKKESRNERRYKGAEKEAKQAEEYTRSLLLKKPQRHFTERKRESIQKEESTEQKTGQETAHEQDNADDEELMEIAKRFSLFPFDKPLIYRGKQSATVIKRRETHIEHKTHRRRMGRYPPHIWHQIERFIEIRLKDALKPLSHIDPSSINSLTYGTLELLFLDAELNVYREALEYLLPFFTGTISPILIKLRNAYEESLKVRDRIIEEIPQLERRVSLRGKAFKSHLRHIDQVYRHSEKRLVNALKELLLHICELTNVIESKNQTIDQLHQELIAEHKRYMNAVDYARIAVLHYERIRHQFEVFVEEYRNEEDHIERDPLILQMRIQDNKNEIDRLKHIIEIMEDDYKNVVTRRRFEMEVELHRRETEQKERLEKGLADILIVHDQYVKKYGRIFEKFEELDRKVQVLMDSGTPRPEWNRCEEHVRGGADRWRAICQYKSSNRKLQVLLSEFTGAGIDDEYFEALGTGPDVPLYLQYEGQLKYRYITHRDVRIYMHDIWDRREEELQDWVAGSRVGPLEQCVAKYLEEVYPRPIIRAEIAYNFVMAMQRLLTKDPAVLFFYEVLLGKVHEQMYHGLIRDITKLRWHARVRMIVVNRDDNKLPEEEFVLVLRRTFRSKSDMHIRDLQIAARTQLANMRRFDAYDVVGLLRNTPEGAWCKDFVQEILRQKREGVEAFADRVNEVMKTMEESEEHLEIGFDDISFVRAFVKVDPLTDHRAIDEYLWWVFGGDPLDTRLPRSVLYERLRNAETSSSLRHFYKGYFRSLGGPVTSYTDLYANLEPCTH